MSKQSPLARVQRCLGEELVVDVGHDLVLDKVEEIMCLAKADVGARVSIRVKRQVVCAVLAGRSEVRSPTEVVDVFAGGIADAYNYGACAVCEF